MGTLTIRIPDDKHERLKALAASKGISVNNTKIKIFTVERWNHNRNDFITV